MEKSGPELTGVFTQLIPELQRAVRSEGYHTPTPIQEQCMAHILNGRDLLGTAQTGTGKTAAFTLPLLQNLVGRPRKTRRGAPRALILAPTRELAIQVHQSLMTYGRYAGLRYAVVYGGVSQFHQVKALNRGVDVLVATPGRLLDLIRQGHILLGGVEVFVLDEVDRMLDMGFIPDIKEVLSMIPEKRQTLFFSATMAPRIEQLANRMVTNPARVSIEPDKPAVERIVQQVLFVGQGDKDDLLVSLLENKDIKKALVFTQMKHAADRVVKKLAQHSIYATAIHGNKSQSARTKALDGFKRGRFHVLVATDVAARGLDVDDITHVINYDLPVEAETYVHRIGRTGRAGAEGNAISFCCAEDRAYLHDIERLLGDPVPVEKDHAFHCEESFRSRKGKPKNFGRGKGANRSGKSRGGPKNYPKRRSGGSGGRKPSRNRR